MGVDLLADQADAHQEPAQVVVHRHLPARQRVDDGEQAVSEQHVPGCEVSVADGHRERVGQQLCHARSPGRRHASPRARVEELTVGAQLVDDLLAGSLAHWTVGLSGAPLEGAEPASGERAAGDGVVEAAAAAAQPAQVEQDAAQRRRVDEGHHEPRLVWDQEQGTDDAEAGRVTTGALDRLQPRPLEKGQFLGGGSLAPQPRTGAAAGPAAGVAAELGERRRYVDSVQVDGEEHTLRPVGQDSHLEAGVWSVGEPLVGVRGDALRERLDESPDRQPCLHRLLGPGDTATRRRSVRLTLGNRGEVAPCPS